MSKITQDLRQLYDKFESLGTFKKFVIIGLLCFGVFYLHKGPPPGQNHFVYLAESFLHGRLGLTGAGTVLAELVHYHGNYYVVYPPMPAIILLPFVAVWGTSVDQSLMSIILAGLSCSVTWLMLTKTGVKGSKALWLTALLGFGTCFWYIASVGSAWYIEQVSGVLFLTVAIVLALYKKNDFFVGLSLGCAYLSESPQFWHFHFSCF